METGPEKCEVEDSNGDGSLEDESPCNCLGNWIVGSVIELNADWLADNSVDPNGDNWRDCGWDGKCSGDEEYDKADFYGTESNGVWDTNEGFELNGQYDLDIQYNIGDRFIDEGNGIENELAEFCYNVTQDNAGNDVCSGDTPFEDRNCNGKWDDLESGDEGNGIWDDDEYFLDDEKLENFINDIV